jgi:hypothetical protein
MKITVEPVGPLEVDAKAVQDAKTDAIGLEAVPKFYRGGQKADAFVLKSYASSGKLLRTARLQVCGKTGRLSLIDLSAAIEPPVDRQKPK